MKEKASTAISSYLVPESRLIEVYIQASEQTRQHRRKRYNSDDDELHRTQDMSRLPILNYRPSLIFNNSPVENEAVIKFAERYLLPFLDDDLQRLADMVRSVPRFPNPGVEFRHCIQRAKDHCIECSIFCT